MKPIKGSIIALALAVSCPPPICGHSKHQAKKIALARVKRGAIKCVELEKENGVLIWSVDIALPPQKNLTDVWVDATTGKITAVEIETPITEKREVAEQRAKRWLSHHNAY